MEAIPDNPSYVPKVHPLAREATAEDPLELMAEPVPGDPAVMLECILQEFAWMGYSADELLAMFHHPGYPVLCQLREHFGEERISRQVRQLAARGGILRLCETLAEPDEPEPHELVALQDFTTSE